MLEVIRRGVKGWVGWAIIGLICLTFALFGLNSYFNGPVDPVVADIDGEEIKQSEFRRAYDQYRNRIRNMMGDNYRPEMVEGMAAKQSVLNNLVEEKVLLQSGVNLGQHLSNADLSEIVRKTPAFQKDGAFDQATYNAVLSRAGMTSDVYESRLRADLLTQEFVGNIQQTAWVTDAQLDAQLRLQNQQREVAYGVVRMADHMDKVTIDEAQIKAHYDANLANYMSPERVSVDYIDLSVVALSEDVVVDDADLITFYEDKQAQFTDPEQRSASHILLEKSDDENAVMLKLTDIKERLTAGEAFDVLAKEHSEDVGSAKKGGDLGYFPTGVMGDAFDSAIAGLENVGDVSDIVEGEGGYHLIQLTGIRAPSAKAFDTVRDEVETLYRAQQAETKFYDLADQLADLSYENPEDISITAEELGLTVQTTDEFARGGGTGIAADEKVLAAVFSDDVLANDLNSEVIEISKDQLIVVHLNKHTPESQLTLTTVSSIIESQLQAEKAREQTAAAGEDKLSSLMSGVAPEMLFIGPDDWQEKASYERTSSELNAQIRQQVFAMPRTADGQVEYKGFAVQNGNYIVAALHDVVEGNLTAVDETAREQTLNQLKQSLGNSERQALIASLKDDAEIEIFSKYLE